MTRILGIDPGSQITGYGVIDSDGTRSVYVSSGCVRVSGESFPERLKVIFESIQEIVSAHGPDEVAIEQVFMHRNADSALKLGQARGAAICAVVTGGLAVSEYTPREIKQAIVGTGKADKEQVQHMVKALLNLSGTLQPDAADALAVALCHSHARKLLDRIPGAERASGGRLK